MLVVLVKPVRKLGRIGEIVSVKDGFGRNYLIPEGYAVRATEANKKMVEEKKRELEEQNIAAKNDAAKLQQKIDGKDVTFIMQASADGRLFGSVGNREIAKALSTAGYDINYSQVSIASPIKTLGVFDVALVLHTEVTASVVVNIARSDSEAVDALREFKNAGSAPIVDILDNVSAEITVGDAT